MENVKALGRKAYDETFKRTLSLVEKNVVPDVLVRSGIRHLLSQRAKMASDDCIAAVHNCRSSLRILLF